MIYQLISSSIRDTDSLVPLNQDAHDAPSECSQTAKPFRPREFRSFMVVPFISLLAALAITLGVLWTKARPYGKIREHLRGMIH